MDADRIYEILESGTKDFITHSTPSGTVLVLGLFAPKSRRVTLGGKVDFAHVEGLCFS